MSDNLKVEGKLHAIFATKDVSDKFKTREFVVETDEQYPQMVKFELSQAKCDAIDSYKEGDRIVVNFNLRGREYTDPKTNEVKYFNTLQAWKLEKGNGGTTTQTAPNTEKPKGNVAAQAKLEPETVSDDLPF